MTIMTFEQIFPSWEKLENSQTIELVNSIKKLSTCRQWGDLCAPKIYKTTYIQCLINFYQDIPAKLFRCIAANIHEI